MNPDSRQGAGQHVFATTHWSVVQEAGQAASPHASAAMERLCGSYWYPLYAYVRRKGYAPDEAQDLTQEFFARLLARNYLNVADRNKGRFRSFLLGSMEHFLAREWKRAHAQKRAGGRVPLALEELEAEQRYALDAAHHLTPARIFDRRWATTVLEQAAARLGEEYGAAGKAGLFQALRSLLTGMAESAPYAELAASLNMREGAVKVAVHRLRQRYGELIRAEILQTVSTPQEAEEELLYLLSVLRD